MDTAVTDTKSCRRCRATVYSRTGDLRGGYVCYDKDAYFQIADANKKYPCLQDEIRRSIEEVLESVYMSLALEEAPDAASDRFIPSAYLGDPGSRGGPDRTPGFAPVIRPPLGWDRVVTEEAEQDIGEIAEQFMPGIVADHLLTFGSDWASGYEELAAILTEAFQFASVGKGHERHGGDGVPWTQQRHVYLGKEFGPGFALGQAAKKLGESQRLDVKNAERELLGAITYIASAIYAMRNRG